MSSTRYENGVVDAVVFTFVSGLISAAGILGYQVVQWLKLGNWIEMPFYLLFEWLRIDLSPLYSMEWQGLRKMLFWILEGSMSFMFVVLGGVLGYLINSIFMRKKKQP